MSFRTTSAVKACSRVLSLRSSFATAQVARSFSHSVTTQSDAGIQSSDIGASNHGQEQVRQTTSETRTHSDQLDEYHEGKGFDELLRVTRSGGARSEITGGADSSGKSAASPASHSAGAQAWKAFLPAEKLGEVASVIVLQDPSGISYRRPHDVQQELDDEDVDIAAIVNAIKQRNRVSGREEVFDAIDSCRPVKTQQGLMGRRAISGADFNKLAEDMYGMFNQAQLSDYFLLSQVKADHRSPRVPDAKYTEDMKRLEFAKEWQPSTDQDIAVFDMKGGSKLPKKRRIISKIIRTTWNLESLEETLRAGTLTIDFQASTIVLWENLKLLNPMLDSLASKHNVRIEVDRLRSKMNITGPQAACAAAAFVVHQRGDDVTELEVPLGSVQSRAGGLVKGSLDLADAYRVAARHNCLLISHEERDAVDVKQKKRRSESAHSPSPNWLLRAVDQPSAEICLRAIVAHSNVRYGDIRCTRNVKNEIESEAQARFIFDEIDSTGYAKTLQGEDTTRSGRITSGTRLGKGNVPARLKVDMNLVQEETFQQALACLEPNPYFGAFTTQINDFKPNNVYKVKFGQLKWPEDASKKNLDNLNPSSIESILNDQGLPPKFNPGAWGISQMLHRAIGFRESEPASVVSELRATLVVDPFSQLQTSDDLIYPSLHFKFELNDINQAYFLRDARVAFDHPSISESNILLPELLSDIQISHQRGFKFGEPLTRREEVHSNYRDFVDNILERVNGRHTSPACGSFRMNVPVWPKRKLTFVNRSTQELDNYVNGLKLRDTRMFPSCIEGVEEIRWDIPDADHVGNRNRGKAIEEQSETSMPLQLVYTKTTPMDTGRSSKEALEIQCFANFRQPHLTVSQKHALLAATNGTLTELNKGVGITSMRYARRPEEAATTPDDAGSKSTEDINASWST